MPRTSEEYTCTVVFTEGSDKRITEAFVDLYYDRQRGLTKQDSNADDKSA